MQMLLTHIKKKETLSPFLHKAKSYFCDKYNNQRCSFPCINKEEPIEPYQIVLDGCC